jgi:integrase/recombinase XerD
MTTNLTPPAGTPERELVSAASPDDRLLAQWLHGRSVHTQAAYTTAVRDFRAVCDVPLDRVTLGDLQVWADQLEQAGLSAGSRALKLGAVRSLLAFGHRLGLLPVNVGGALRLPKRSSQLAQRILEESDVHALLAAARLHVERVRTERPRAPTVHAEARRDYLLLKLLYVAGLRVSELCALHWSDLQVRGEGGQVTVTGKGEKTRAVLLPAPLWRELHDLRGSVGDSPVFRSRKGGALDRSQVLRIVQAAAKRAGIAAAVSPHWLRHAHASHALDRGATVALVAATLGHANIATTGRYLHARPEDSSSRYLAL